MFMKTLGLIGMRLGLYKASRLVVLQELEVRSLKVTLVNAIKQRTDRRQEETRRKPRKPTWKKDRTLYLEEPRPNPIRKRLTGTMRRMCLGACGAPFAHKLP